MASWAARGRLDAELSVYREHARRVAAQPAPDTLISVVMPTHNRASVLPRAIDSVLAQSHERLELIVVDDASSDETPDVIGGFADPRVRSLRMSAASGGSGARNAGLDAARGDVIAYLDDDNEMDPSWLRTVAWAFEHHPRAEVAYGALILDDGRLPRLYHPRWDPDDIDHGNPVDQNALAHRAGLPGAYYDERLRYGSDWDIAHRLTRERDPLRLPAVAARYELSGERLSSAVPARRAFYELSRELRGRRRLRVAAEGVDSAGLKREAQLVPVVPWPQERPDVLLSSGGPSSASLLRRAGAVGVPVVVVGDAPVSWPVIAALDSIPSVRELRAVVEADIAARVWGFGADGAAPDALAA